MDSRKENLLKIIVEEYVKSATPVGSTLVVEKYLPEISSATVRNDMADLEEAGLICQPHTSAGRIPTSAGYDYYLNEIGATEKLSIKDRKELDKISEMIGGDEGGIKTLAKALAESSDNTVLVGFSPFNVYYTGISNLFKQPEFARHQLVYSMSEMIDHLDEVMGKIFHEIEAEAKILQGKGNPFGEMSAVVLAKYVCGGREGLIGILGPSRMDYGRNLGLVRYAQKLISNLS